VHVPRRYPAAHAALFQLTDDLYGDRLVLADMADEQDEIGLLHRVAVRLIAQRRSLNLIPI
jgi:hypothetical protein